jgi:hypothetical protein
VTFDELPGGVTLASKSPFAASVARALERCHDATAWYGFGVPIRDPAEAVMTLRNEIADPRCATTAAQAAHV